MQCAWDSDLLGGYESEFLPGAEQPIGARFWANNPPKLARRLRQFGPEFLIVFGYNKAVMLRALGWGIHARVPVGMFSDSELVRPRAWWKRWLKRAGLPLLFRSVSAFLTVGDNNEAYFRHYGVPARRLFRCGIPTDEAAFLHARKQGAEIRMRARAIWGIGVDDFVLLFVGKLIARKRPLDLLRAAAQLKQESHSNRKVVVVYAGDGELRECLVREAAASGLQNVKFLGFVNQRELPSTYAGADVLVHPAEEDPHPLCVTEAAMVGIPAIVSDRLGCVGPTDTARPGENALVFPVGNTEALASAIASLLEEPERTSRMAAATLQVSEENGLDAVVRGILNASCAVVKGKTP